MVVFINFNPFYFPILKFLLLTIKCVFEQQNLQMFGPKLNTYE